MLSLLCATALCAWKRQQIIKPDIDNYGIFGRAVDISSAESGKIAVSASWETVGDRYRVGVIYVFEYNSQTSNFEQKHKLIPEDPADGRVKLNNTGSTLKITNDGRRIVAGAPFSTVDGQPEVGALVVWDFDDASKTYKQTKVITSVAHATEDDANQGFGRSLTITSDGKSIASAYYNKPKVSAFADQQGAVFVAMETSTGWNNPIKLTPPAKHAGKRLKFGSDLAFVDASHLVVAVTLFDNYWQAGTCYFQKTSSTSWDLVQEILPSEVNHGEFESHKFEQYGAPISMPDSDTLGIMGTFGKDEKPSGAIFLLHKSAEGGWDAARSQAVLFPERTALTGLSFCGRDIFMTHAGNFMHPENKSRTTDGIIFYRRNSKGDFEPRLLETAYPEADFPELLTFGSDLAWRPDCGALLVGGMTKYPHMEGDPRSDEPDSNSRAYLFVWEDDSKNGTNVVAAAIGAVCAALLIIAFVVGGVIYARRHRGMCVRGAIRADLSEPLNAAKV